MKIASFNINNVNRRLANLVDWLRASEPDVVCLRSSRRQLGVPRESSARGRIRRGVARGEELERSRDPGALSAHRHPHGAARRPG